MLRGVLLSHSRKFSLNSQSCKKESSNYNNQMVNDMVEQKHTKHIKTVENKQPEYLKTKLLATYFLLKLVRKVPSITVCSANYQNCIKMSGRKSQYVFGKPVGRWQIKAVLQTRDQHRTHVNGAS